MLKHLAILSCSLITTACTSKQKKLTPEQQAIIDKSKDNFVFVEGGTFIMGNNNVYNAPEHQVTLDNYSISKYETTWKEFDLYHVINDMEIIGSNYRGILDEFNPEYPVSKTTWYRAKNYCEWLGKQIGVPLSLPSEAQWEYAAHSRGQKVEHATNNGKADSGKYKENNYGFEAVGEFPPNPLGLYDMTGGRPEWTNDWFVQYEEGPLVNPRYDSDSIPYASKKMIRGWHHLRYSVYSRRGNQDPKNSGTGVGFRCACNQKTPIN